MSLDWSITKVKDWKAISLAEENGIEGRKTEKLVWACMAVDLPGITAKNVDEFFFRVELLEKLRGAFLAYNIRDESAPGGWRTEERPMTRADIERRIGLTTNVASKPRGAWLKKVTAKAA